MGIESHILEGLKVVGEWSKQGNSGSINMTAGQWYDIATVAFHALKDHVYLITVTATGFCYGNSSQQVKYNVTVDGPNVVVTEQAAGFNSASWDTLIAIPIMLAGHYRCTADADVHAVFRHWKQSASSDWVLDEARHVMQVIDLGVQS